MYDLVIRGAEVVDGTGTPGRPADVAVQGERIVAVGHEMGGAHRTIDADGLVLTPGFVDIHTHFDGQATWDPYLTPSCWHGVTTAVMGNCGVGFAPVRPGSHQALIDIMEGVEDIPGAALAEGIRGATPKPAASALVQRKNRRREKRLLVNTVISSFYD